jgi:polyhydroxybutyrate depolymerase
MMTLRLGCEISSKLAAIAPVIANMPSNIIGTCQPDAPLAVLLMNGTDDPLVPYHGGYVHFFRKQMGEVVSTDATIAFWVRHNQCDPVPTVRDLPDLDTGDHSKVTVTAYADPNGKTEVVLYTVLGGGHTLPGSNIPNRPRVLGQKNNDIDGAKVIWQFFRKYSRQVSRLEVPEYSIRLARN